MLVRALETFDVGTSYVENVLAATVITFQLFFCAVEIVAIGEVLYPSNGLDRERRKDVSYLVLQQPQSFG